MTRIVAAVTAGLLAAAAWFVSAPAEESPPVTFRAPVEVDPGSAGSGVWYCPSIVATSAVDTVITVAAMEPATASFTFPNPVPGERADTIRLNLTGPGADELQTSEVVVRGESPGFVEFSTQQAAAFAITTGGGRSAGDVCVASVPKVWHIPLGSTQEGRAAILRLFNPFPEIAIVRIDATSELGVEPLSELEAFSVPARSWRDVEFGGSDGELRLRDALTVSVSGEEGLVLPVAIVSSGGDEAVWPGSGPATRWEFPTARIAGMETSLLLTNLGREPATVSIDVLTPEGRIDDARIVELGGGAPAAVPVDDLAEGAMGIVIRATQPVAAAVVVSGDGGVAGTVSTPGPANRWVVPGGDASETGVTSLWVMNSSDRPATVTILPLGGTSPVADKVLVEPGTMRQVLVAEDVPAFLLDSAVPFTAAWTRQAEGSLAIVTGIQVMP